MTFEEILPVSLNVSKFNHTLLTASNDLKDFIDSYTNWKEIFDLRERHDIMEFNTSKNFFSNNYIMDIFFICYCSNFFTSYSFNSVYCVNTRNLEPY